MGDDEVEARRAARELAGELINLYAERKTRVGHRFDEDSDWQLEFERAFPYRETDDQLEAIEQTKADMEDPQPMDRLICGDVGYGKTEVALRAAFKAAADGKQVLFLVPTTILAQQHHGTFSERLRDYPFRIELLSRFRSPKEQRAVLRDFAAGKVDILIGTHRLLSRDVQPKDLGLVIVDEEQRFGVRQKELLRQLRLRVDVLSLSATPIPRTLQMSLAGLRDISVIETPPEGRRPIHTYVGEYDEELVKGAIERELSRDGQVFFLHDRVETIDEAAERLRALVPEGARRWSRTARWRRRQLEQTMIDFLRGEADVLVSTTIIESGIDIPQANTLIVERADKLGLAQLYQIRGRVGRSRERAYAYLLYPSAAALSARGGRAAGDAVRLHRARLGLQDRDARPRDPRRRQPARRGAVRSRRGGRLRALLPDARRGGPGALEERDGEAAATSAGSRCGSTCRSTPTSRPTTSPTRWRRSTSTAGSPPPASPTSWRALAEELEDRFGPLPEPVENLIKLQEARIKLGRAGARTVEFRAGRLVVAPIALDLEQVKALREEVPEAVYESLKKTLRIPVPEEPAERFAAVLHAADAPAARAGRSWLRRPPRAPALKWRRRAAAAAIVPAPCFVELARLVSRDRDRRGPRGRPVRLRWRRRRASPPNAVADGRRRADLERGLRPLARGRLAHPAAAATGLEEEAASRPSRAAPSTSSSRNQVMQFLVSAQWIAGEAADRGPDARRDEEIKRSFERTQGPVVPEREGLPALPEDVRPDAGGHRLPRALGRAREQDPRRRSPRTRQRSRDDDIEDYYKQNEAQFSQPERRDLQVVVNKSEAKAQGGAERLQGGESFKKVVKDLSTDPATKQQDGQLLGIAKGQQEKALDAAVFAAQRGELAGPVKTQQGYYVFKVNKDHPGLEAEPRAVQGGHPPAAHLTEAAAGARQVHARASATKWRDKTDCREGLRDSRLLERRGAAARPGAGRPAGEERPGTPPALGGAPLVPQPAHRRRRAAGRRARRCPGGAPGGGGRRSARQPPARRPAAGAGRRARGAPPACPVACPRASPQQAYRSRARRSRAHRSRAPPQQAPPQQAPPGG